MAEYKGINLTANENGTVLDPGVWGGKVQLVRDSATFASVGANDVAYLGYLPKNARILPNSFIKYGAMGVVGSTKASFKIGTLGTSNKFGTVSDAEAAGSFTFTSSSAGEAGPIVVTIVNPGSATNVPVEAWIFYVQAGVEAWPRRRNGGVEGADEAGGGDSGSGGGDSGYGSSAFDYDENNDLMPALTILLPLTGAFDYDENNDLMPALTISLPLTGPFVLDELYDLMPA